MKKGCILLFIISQLYLSLSYANQHDTPMILGTAVDNNRGFVTTRDLFGATTSGITIKNVTSGPGTIYNLTGLYIQTLYSPFGPEGTNYGSAVGALWSNVTLSPSATTKVGANFLYNMIMTYLYQNNISTGEGDVITPGDATGGTNWLVFLGVAQGTTVTSTANIYSPTPGHGNDLVYIDQTSTSFSQQICVTCNDATQTCVLGSTGACYHTTSTSSAEQDIPCNLDGSTGCAAGVYPPS